MNQISNKKLEDFLQVRANFLEIRKSMHKFLNDESRKNGLDIKRLTDDYDRGFMPWIYYGYDIHKMDMDNTTCYILWNDVLWYVLLRNSYHKGSYR